MGVIIYNIGIQLYYLLAWLVSPFNQKARLWVLGRKKVWAELEGKFKAGEQVAWFHAASLGEFEQGRPLMEELKKKDPSIKILLTFFSPSGYEIRKNYEGADVICYLPVDSARNAKRMIGLVNPAIVFFIKYEYWYNYIKAATDGKRRVFAISAIFRENQIFFKQYGGWYLKLLKRFDHFFVQNEKSKQLLNSAGIDQVTVAGDSRFDRVAQIAKDAKSIPVAEQFSKGAFTFVCGSTWPKDEELLAEYINQAPANVKLIIAPHEIHQAHIDSLTALIKKPYILFSEAENQELTDKQVLIINNIGMLSAIYRYGKVAYIGGGFGAGIHNTLEAAVYAMPVVFGPKYQKFQEAKDLIACDGSQTISTYQELKTYFDRYSSESEVLEKAGLAAGAYVQSMTGATEAVMGYLGM